MSKRYEPIDVVLDIIKVAVAVIIGFIIIRALLSAL